MEFGSIENYENTLNISPTEDITISLICNGNGIKDYVLNNITGAESQCDLINKDISTFLPYYTTTFKTKSKIYKHNNKVNIITLNNQPINLFINEDEEVVDKYLWRLQDTTSIDDTFKRNYDIVTL